MRRQKVNNESIKEYFMYAKDKYLLNFVPPEAKNIKICNLSKKRFTVNDVFSFSLLFDVGGEKHKRDYVLKLFPQNEKNCEKEYMILKLLNLERVLVPQVLVREIDCKFFGAPFIIMEKVDGVPFKKYLNSVDENGARRVIERFACALLKLHEVKWKKYELKFLEIPEDDYAYAEKQVFWEQELPDYVNKKGFKWATDWLKFNARKNPCHRYSLVRRDMNLNNFIVTKDIDIFMLDWEWVDVGDPLIDVGYAYHNIKHAFGVRNINKKGIRMASHFLKAYTEKATHKINPATLKYYLFSTGLREAIYLRYLKEQIENLSFVKRFGLIYLPIYPYIWWHYKSRYKHLEKYLRSVATGYEDEMFRTTGGKILSKMELEKILRFLKAESTDLILDIGVGSGRVSREISKIGAYVVAVDVNREAVLSAKMRQHPVKYEVILADGQFLPFKSGCFDGIICIRTLKYFSNYHLGISEMSRVLKPNGRLIVDFSSILGYESLLRYVTPVVSARGAHIFNFYKIRNLLTYHGLITEKYTWLQKIPHNFWNLFDNKIMLRLLLICEEVLGKLTPEIFSRSILFRCVKKVQLTV